MRAWFRIGLVKLGVPGILTTMQSEEKAGGDHFLNVSEQTNRSRSTVVGKMSSSYYSTIEFFARLQHN